MGVATFICLAGHAACFVTLPSPAHFVGLLVYDTYLTRLWCQFAKPPSTKGFASLVGVSLDDVMLILVAACLLIFGI